MVSSSLVLPVVFSAEQSCGVQVHAVCQLSKAARRRVRHRRTAVLKAQHSSMRISEILQAGHAAGTTCEVTNGAPGIEALLRLESKVDSVMQFLCCLTLSGRCVADSEITDYGVPVETLRKECAAVRTMQRAWRSRQVRRRSFSAMGGGSCSEGEKCPHVDEQVPRSAETKSLVGVWETLDPWLFLDRIELGRLSTTCCHNRDLVSRFTPLNDFMAQMGNGADAETSNSKDIPTLSASQVHSIIDVVVAGLRESPTGAKVSAEWFSQLVENLKSRYQESQAILYSSSHVKELVEFVGRLCGEAALETTETARGD